MFYACPSTLRLTELSRRIDEDLLKINSTELVASKACNPTQLKAFQS